MLEWISYNAQGAAGVGSPASGTLGQGVNSCVNQLMPKSLPPTEDAEAIRAAIKQQCEGQIAALRGAARNLLANARLVHSGAMEGINSIGLSISAASASMDALRCDDAAKDIATAKLTHQEVQQDAQTLIGLQVEVESDMLPQSFFDSQVRNVHAEVVQLAAQVMGQLDATGSMIESTETAVGDCRREKAAEPGPGPGPAPEPEPEPQKPKTSKAGTPWAIFALGAAALGAIWYGSRRGAGASAGDLAI